MFSPKSMSFDAITVLLNSPERDERDRLTERWRDHKLSELNFVGVVAALLTGCLTSTGSWPNVLPNGRSAPWQVRTSWYIGIVFGLASILSAADQTIRLHRLSSHRDALSHIRHLLRSAAEDVDGTIRPRYWQIYTWQLPVLFLTCSVITMIVGIMVLVWSATWHPGRSDWWDENTKSAITLTIVAGLTVALFFTSQISLYSSVSELEEDESD